MKVLVLLIGIGKYLDLIDGLINSFKNIGEDVNPQFILFTDNIETKLEVEEKWTIYKKYYADLGWPMNTLLRYRMFCSVIDEMNEIAPDYILFMNANLRLLDGVLFDSIKDADLFFARHPGYTMLRYILPRKYETNKESRASCSIFSVFFGKYIQGTLWGGKTTKFLAMLETLNEMCEDDLSRGVIARVHDESYLNKYMQLTKGFKILSTAYHWPEGWFRMRKVHVLSADKDKILGAAYMKKLKRV